jgi:hypothetical protein
MQSILGYIILREDEDKMRYCYFPMAIFTGEYLTHPGTSPKLSSGLFILQADFNCHVNSFFVVV